MLAAQHHDNDDILKKLSQKNHNKKYQRKESEPSLAIAKGFSSSEQWEVVYYNTRQGNQILFSKKYNGQLH